MIPLETKLADVNCVVICLKVLTIFETFLGRLTDRGINMFDYVFQVLVFKMLLVQSAFELLVIKEYWFSKSKKRTLVIVNRFFYFFVFYVTY